MVERCRAGQSDRTRRAGPAGLAACGRPQRGVATGDRCAPRQAGADICAVTDGGLTAMDWAKGYGWVALADFLRTCSGRRHGSCQVRHHARRVLRLRLAARKGGGEGGSDGARHGAAGVRAEQLLCAGGAHDQDLQHVARRAGRGCGFEGWSSRACACVPDRCGCRRYSERYI